MILKKWLQFLFKEYVAIFCFYSWGVFTSSEFSSLIDFRSSSYLSLINNFHPTVKANAINKTPNKVFTPLGPECFKGTLAGSTTANAGLHSCTLARAFCNWVAT